METQSLEKLHKVFLQSAGICTDSRKIKKGELFFALKGANFNGNLFAEDALRAGCILAVSERDDLKGKPGIWYTEDSLKLLQDLARFHRHYVNPGLVAITGSNGKTTTKELCAAVLARRYRVLSTCGNLNNHIGVPLTLLSLKDEEVAVVEMGANHPEEIRMLAGIANPMLGMITNVGKAHLEGFGSLEGVLQAKGELYEHLAQTGGTAIVDGEDALLMRKAADCGVDILKVAPDGELDVGARIIEQRPFLRVELNLGSIRTVVDTRLVGAYNLQNIRLAAALGLRLRVEADQIAEAIASYRPDNQRSQLIEGGRNRIILDSYNANPSSMREAIGGMQASKESPGMLILGDMAELGASSEEEHRELLEWVKGLGIEKILLVGPIFSKVGEPSAAISVFPDRQALEQWLKKEKPEGYLVLVKGSRVMALEELEKILRYG